MKLRLRQVVFVLFAFFFGGHLAIAQTCDVTWRKADNPHVISGTVTIPANQIVCLEAGVQVQFASDGVLDLLGTIVGDGTASDPITFTGLNVFPNRILLPGTLDLQFADVGVPVNLNRGTFLFRDGRFRARGLIFGGFAFLSLENVVFDSNDPIQGNNANITASSFTAVLRNVTFRNRAYFSLYNSYVFPDGLVSETSAFHGLEFGSLVQPLYLANLSITNSAGAGLKLSGGNYFIGPNVVIANAEYPIAGAAGLLPGSQVPASGNRNNWVETGQASGELIFAPISVPYVMTAFNGGVTFLPGVTIKARPGFAFNSEGGGVRLLGLPEAPITIEPLTAGQKWISGQFNTPGDRLEYVTLNGSQLGIVNPGGAGASYYIDQSILRNHDTALTSPGFSSAFLQGNLFAANGVAIDDAEGTASVSGRTNPNLFEGNSAAVNAYANNSDVRYNWWNAPSGPASPLNPGGTGDILNGSRPRFQPFRTARPDLTDRPPIVRLPSVPYGFALGSYQGLLDARSRQIITWRATDDRQIVKQKIFFSPAGNERDSFTIIADNLPASQTSFDLNVPSVGFQPSGLPAFVRVVAIDDRGQEGWDEWQVLVPSDETPGNLNITTNLAGQTFRGGDRFPVSWTSTFPFGESYQVFLLLDGDRKLLSGASGNATGTFSEVIIPFVSTDSARLAVVVFGSINRQEWFFSPPFSIRPEARFPDAPPVVTLNSPAANAQFPAGSSIPIQWTATDDEAVRRFDLQASTDGARTWVSIAENLPATATSFAWQPNFSGSLNDVRVRVVATDLRFQNSSAGANRIFGITSPANAAPSTQLTFPSNNASFASGKSIFLAANASDPDGNVSRVEFYATVDYLGQGGSPSTTLIGSDATAPYQVAWNYPSADTYAITARVIDNRGGTTVSAPINVTVTPVNPQAPLPISPPELTEPRDGAALPANSPVTLLATPGNGNRPIVRVEFYRGTTLIGSDTTPPYSVTVNNVPNGRQTFFARAVANNGAESTSALADVSIGLPTAIGAVSRKTHGSAGVFDVDLPLSGTPAVESRSSTAGHSLVFTFSNPIASGSAAITSGSATLNGSPTFSGNTMTVNLTGVANAQTLTVSLSNVTDTFGQVLLSTSVSMSVLLGDSNGNNSVTASDIAQTKASVGAALSSANFRSDFNLSGAINATDVAIAKAAASGAAAPAR